MAKRDYGGNINDCLKEEGNLTVREAATLALATSGAAYVVGVLVTSNPVTGAILAVTATIITSADWIAAEIKCASKVCPYEVSH